MNQAIMQRLILAKTLMIRARNEIKDRNDDMALATAVLHMHDSVDNFLGAVTSHLAIHIPSGKDAMMQVYEQIAHSGQLASLDSKTELNQLNAIRNSIKHHGVMPHPSQVTALVPVIATFCNNISKECFGETLDDMRVSMLIQVEARRHELEAIEALIDKGDYRAAIEQAGIGLFKCFDSHQWRFSLLREFTSGKQPKDDKNVFPEGDYEKARLELGEYGIDPYLYHRFKNIAPEIGYDNLRDRNIIIRHDALTWHHKNWTKENAIFCLNFLSTLLLKQQRGYGGYTIYHKRGPQKVTFNKESIVYVKKGGELHRAFVAKMGSNLEGMISGYVNGDWEVYDKSYDPIYASMPVAYIDEAPDYVGYYLVKDDIDIESDEHFKKMSF